MTPAPEPEADVSSYGRYAVDFSNPNSTWAIAASMIRNGSTVLDVGCSAGQMAERLAQYKGCTVDGVEIDPSDGEEARKHCRDVFVGDVLDVLPAISRTYDHILLLDVLEHLLDPVAALGALAPLVATGGTFVVSVPNMAHSSVRLALLTGRFPYEDDGLLDRTHLRFFDLEQLQSVVRLSGASVLRRSATYHDLPREVIESSLAEVGLKATDSFVEQMNDERAATYQYVLELSPAPGGASVDEAPVGYVGPLHQYRYFYQDAAAAAHDAQEEVARLRKELAQRYATSVVPPRWVLAVWKRVARRVRRSG